LSLQERKVMRLITAVLLALVMISAADEVTFQPDAAVGKDSWIIDTAPSWNGGVDTSLSVGWWQGASYRSFIEFVELNSAVYQGVSVNSATLRLYLELAGGAGNEYEIGICASSWDEITINWNNAPSAFDTHTEYYPSAVGWLDIDVTDNVQSWLDGSNPNNGFILFDMAGTEEYITPYSSDFPDPDLRPQLVLDYNPLALEGTTWALIKAGF